ncbi:MAG: hypothetical protein JRI58_05445 [Deltaproteobacteria bacterium]|nr:hypothetical protein [Deltaproteobacteria bacterium]MBW2074177.1 hypothetical protein [Deltaproteobacteria bacterium]
MKTNHGYGYGPSDYGLRFIESTTDNGQRTTNILLGLSIGSDRSGILDHPGGIPANSKHLVYQGYQFRICFSMLAEQRNFDPPLASKAHTA